MLPGMEAASAGAVRVPPLLDVRNLSKSFAGVRALKDVNLEVLPGEVHCILGQNGAGKSTLIKALSGVHQPDGGEIRWDGQPVRLASPTAALELGIATMYQELDVVDGLNVTENIFLGHEDARGGVLRVKDARRRARELLARLGHADLPPGAEVGGLAGGQQADRQPGPGAVPQRPAHHHGRAQRHPGLGGGGEPVPGDPGTDRPEYCRRLHLPPAGGDPADRQPHLGAQGRLQHGILAAGCRRPPRGPGAVDDRTGRRQRVSAARCGPVRGSGAASGAGPGAGRVLCGRELHGARRGNPRARRAGGVRPVRDPGNDVRGAQGHRRNGERRRPGAAARFRARRRNRRRRAFPGGTQEPGPAAGGTGLPERHPLHLRAVRAARAAQRAPGKGCGPGADDGAAGGSAGSGPPGPHPVRRQPAKGAAGPLADPRHPGAAAG
ncbi:ATP-binding cassette domain-containing protein [Arthrobacter sp. ATA002]|uniref:ATP-binding cassette domain-containing protein n=1 Tax=Arthrobacter sp. ATA002 TaxID=2991715 RepID=UPI003FA41AE8